MIIVGHYVQRFGAIRQTLVLKRRTCLGVRRFFKNTVNLCYLFEMAILPVSKVSILMFFNINSILSRIPGARAESGTRTAGQGPDTEGVRGLKALGVRDLSYRLAFLACTVTPCNKRVSHRVLTNVLKSLKRS